MEAVGAAAAAAYGLHLFTDVFEPTVAEQLDPDRFTALTLVEREALTADTARLRFRVSRQQGGRATERAAGAVIAQGAWAVDVKDHLVQTFRTYTPVGWAAGGADGAGHCDLVVKRYTGGSVSRFLHGTQVGDQVEMRGPVLTWPYAAGRYKHVYMVAGGTGAAPMVQLAERILADPADAATRISLLYGAQTAADLVFRRRLDALAAQHAGRLDVAYLVEHGAADAKAREGRPDAASVGALVRGFDAAADVVLVCGPDAMMAAVCGERPVGPGRGQGTLRGVLH
ncbi:hypothetical protein LPJ61_003256 [Coemansia biformis]|uniref:FAD-binding FR-type domain-containing protein n=1 Tax=Coemansia biformis TaxID=1286918 RepID=A0A9W7YDD7_9FUNG|nr:hypothetical protein LPJ61_003256 [Coemansia biformis]